ncbi:hypothetical protein [Streptosporangium sp. V21-05]|uniref:hypothetical protein n=1 Tax=Streptosporangium sp. V21-05 TaxID=3446115 RepID=UPI003F529537
MSRISRADRAKLSTLNHDEATQWAAKQIKNGASRAELRDIARAENRRQDGNWGVVDALRNA